MTTTKLLQWGRALATTSCAKVRPGGVLTLPCRTGPDAAERTTTTPIDLSVFSSKGRTAYARFDLARAWAQAEGSHDQEALRALNAADRLAPVRLRNDPISGSGDDT
ncbi:MAG TPA: hypothetical protein VGO16_11650 [Pseudonocardiaceae bacterium]|nr:hypothetical protein [Pseudonocardiaceae bacterium]